MLQHKNVSIQVIATKSSLVFYDLKEVERASGGKVRVWTDEEDWKVRPKWQSCILTVLHT
jgi:phosphopantothenoylcysteine decarboxylase